ncbi:MAG: hypothetical protein FD151_1305, partial [bacterium]
VDMSLVEICQTSVLSARQRRKILRGLLDSRDLGSETYFQMKGEGYVVLFWR